MSAPGRKKALAWRAVCVFIAVSYLVIVDGPVAQSAQRPALQRLRYGCVFCSCHQITVLGLIPAAESLRIAEPDGRLTGSIGWPARSAFCCPSFRAALDLMAPARGRDGGLLAVPGEALGHEVPALVRPLADFIAAQIARRGAPDNLAAACLP